MSRIGKKPIQLPTGVTVVVGKDLIEVSGPKGKMYHKVLPRIVVELSDDGKTVEVKRERDDRQSRAYHGLLRSLLANAVTGVSTGFTRKLAIEGIGYRADVKGSSVSFQLGYSHTIDFPIPDDVQIEVDKQNNITVTGMDKQRVGQVAAEIRRLRPPDVYKGKGIRYADEVIHKKVGKAGA